MQEIVFAFLGKENALKEEALEDLKKEVLAGANADLNYTIFYSEQFDPHQFQDAVNTQPFLSPKRFIVIRDIDRLSTPAKDSVIGYIKNPSKNTVLVLTTEMDSRYFDSSKDEFYSQVLQYANVRDFEPLKGERLTRYLAGIIAANKKSADEEAIALLVENLGNDLGNLKKAVEQLVTYVGAREKIEKGDVEALVGRSLEETVFDLTRAICQGKTERSLSVLSGLFKESVSPENIIGAIGAEFRRLLKIKGLMEGGKNQWQIRNELRLSQQVVAALMAIANGLTSDDIKKIFNLLLTADHECKNRNLDKNEKWIIMESLAVKLSAFAGGQVG